MRFLSKAPSCAHRHMFRTTCKNEKMLLSPNIVISTCFMCILAHYYDRK